MQARTPAAAHGTRQIDRQDRLCKVSGNTAKALQITRWISAHACIGFAPPTD